MYVANVQVLFGCILGVSNEVTYHAICTTPYTHTCILRMNITLTNGGIHHIVIDFSTNSRALVKTVVNVSSPPVCSTLQAKAPVNMTNRYTWRREAILSIVA